MANLITRNDDSMLMGDDFFDHFFSNFMRNNHFSVDIKETDSEYDIKADLPGFDKKDLTVDYRDDLLTISAQHEDVLEDKDEKGNFLRQERSRNSYRRQFVLRNVKEDNIKAEFKNGVLNLTLPKADTTDSKKKQITIN